MDYCDIFCTAFDKQNVSPDVVRSFRVESSVEEEYSKIAFRYLLKCQRLENIHIDTSVFEYDLNDEDIKSFCEVIAHNKSTLKSMYMHFDLNNDMKPMFKTIIYSLLDMSHLVALHIEGFTLPHDDFTLLCTFLSGSCRLEMISIIDTKCETWTESELNICNMLSVYSIPSEDSMFDMSWDLHEVDLSKHPQLQYLQYDKTVSVTRVNTSNLESFSFRLLHSTNYVKVFDTFSTANKLTQLELTYAIFDSSRHSPYHAVTEKMISVLSLLYQLRELTLRCFTLTDNIMKFSSEMKSMKIIKLDRVTMSLATWRQFVDSLPLMLLPVTVDADSMCITRDVEDFYPDGEDFYPAIFSWAGRVVEEGAAWQYVREQGVFFNVEYELTHWVMFSTKK